MKIFSVIDGIITAKDRQYGKLSELPAHRILGWLDPHSGWQVP